jgi:hypothetical protein
LTVKLSLMRGLPNLLRTNTLSEKIILVWVCEKR